MMDSTVQIEVKYTGIAHLIMWGVAAEEPHFVNGWLGSGVVIGKDGDGVSQSINSVILTANHVLSVPEVGKNYSLGQYGIVEVKTVEITLYTTDGRVCYLKPILNGVDQNQDDVAIGIADCDAGRIAKVADRSPSRGDRIYVVGHPIGYPGTVVTEGFAGAWSRGMKEVFAAATHGSSGGPIFNLDGEIVGLLTQGMDDFNHICFSPPMAHIQKIIKDYNDLN